MKIASLNGRPEIFYTIQGEGKNLGQPSIFVRSSLCNLHCIWCDTDYTWNWEGTSFKHNKDSQPGYKKFKKENQIIHMHPLQVVEEICKYKCKNIVITGGEPLLQQEDWVTIMKEVRKIDTSYWFEVETNGTMMPTKSFDSLINQYNVSPKIENSGNTKKLREKSSVYQYFSKNSKAIFKYVVSKKEDLAEIQKLVNAYRIEFTKVFLIAEGITEEQLKAKQIWLIEECKLRGFNFSTRLHIHVYGNERGV